MRVAWVIKKSDLFQYNIPDVSSLDNWETYKYFAVQLMRRAYKVTGSLGPPYLILSIVHWSSTWADQEDWLQISTGIITLGGSTTAG